MGQPPSSIFLTFPQNPQRLLFDGREFASVFHAGPCGSIRIYRGNPPSGRQSCSQRHLEQIFSPLKGGIWIVCRGFAGTLGFISQWRFTKAETMLSNIRFMLDPTGPTVCVVFGLDAVNWLVHGEHCRVHCNRVHEIPYTYFYRQERCNDRNSFLALSF